MDAFLECVDDNYLTFKFSARKRGCIIFFERKMPQIFPTPFWETIKRVKNSIYQRPVSFLRTADYFHV